MRFGWLFRVFFIVYCIEAGIFLVLSPWVPTWDRALANVPLGALRALLLHPVVRGSVSGFGLVHLVWAVHDFEVLLAWRRRRAGAEV